MRSDQIKPVTMSDRLAPTSLVLVCVCVYACGICIDGQ